MVTYTTRAAIPHAIVFINDPIMIIDVPENTGAAPALSTRNCVTIWTQHEDEGEVELSISDEPPPAALVPAFSGFIEVENGRIAYNNSSAEEILGADVASGIVPIEVFVDQMPIAEVVFCRAALTEAQPA
ncbi:hypothetical protein [Sphingomonas sp. BK235]|uniref:hypothetical protein n=1 Tax=Sphingomonas sp. BK235 TaxID=2512131 RepID=UPI001053F50D|nr:hypothetical protein [Sphingomonas sp. BK235]